MARDAEEALRRGFPISLLGHVGWLPSPVNRMMDREGPTAALQEVSWGWKVVGGRTRSLRGICVAGTLLSPRVRHGAALEFTRKGPEVRA